MFFFSNVDNHPLPHPHPLPLSSSSSSSFFFSESAIPSEAEQRRNIILHNHRCLLAFIAALRETKEQIRTLFLRKIQFLNKLETLRKSRFFFVSREKVRVPWIQKLYCSWTLIFFFRGLENFRVCNYNNYTVPGL